jgi:hypothetical protein
MSLFGSTLSITDGFSNTFRNFSSSLNESVNDFKSFTNAIGMSEKENRRSLQNMQSDMNRYTKFYVSQGYTMSQAMTEASRHIEKESVSTGNKWVDAFGKIKQVGIDSFEGIKSKMDSFSNSTLGTVSKLTAGFVSVAGAVKGFETAFETGSEYQNLRLILNNLYGNDSKGGSQFAMATNFASNSIWQERDVVRSLAMLKGSGLKDDKSSLGEMSDLGSYEKALGVGDINQATRAYMEMTEGRWNMVTMELGIKREDVEGFASKNGMKSFDNKNGEVTDKTALEDAFKKFIDARGITGLTDKLKDTFTGKMSTLKDNVSKTLADLIGVGNDGVVRAGSLFDNFIKGMNKFITKIDEFSKSSSFDTISKAITDIGSAISSGFNYLMDHPEIAATILKFTAGLLAFNVISSLVSPIFSIVGAVSALLPFLAPIAAVLVPVAIGVGMAIGLFESLSSILSSDGLLHQGISWLLGNIPLVGTFLQQWWEDSTTTIKEWLNDLWNWIQNKFGFGSSDSKGDTIATNPHIHADNDTAHWYTGNLKDNKVNYQTATDLKNNGSIVNTDASKTSVTNKNDVSIHVDKVEKTADVDDFMDTVVKKLNKYSATRNNLG